jgi:alpha-mannosidase
LNDPLIVAGGQGSRGAGEQISPGLRSPVSGLLSTDQPNLIIETIKQAEDGNGLIVRLYENQRQRGPVTLTTGFSLSRVWQTNLLEENQATLPTDGNRVTFFVKPYQIVTLRLVPA